MTDTDAINRGDSARLTLSEHWASRRLTQYESKGDRDAYDRTSHAHSLTPILGGCGS